ncbi:putative UDP-galactose transporter [Aspergillus alliaceus]|uniref:putative UDP-galactose transporter n=1 Tax=Petromyces alliaceus TaxID=209559 RepID=UPI0012A40F62|nr:udp-galactose transporter [Aspergillus alliaceus]KAB8229776.1 udp-galactose transporter [Aspergillus alliaceus]
MGESAQRPSSGPAPGWKNFSWVLLTAHYTTFVLLLHYSRVMPSTNGKRYLTSTAVFFNEVVKLAISLTIALYEVSKTAPPSVPATSLFFSLTAAVFSGDSWKLAIPASLYTLANSLQYIALSNLQAAPFQVTYQLKLIATAVLSVIILNRNISLRKWGLMLLLLVGVGLVQIPINGSGDVSLQDEAAHHAFPRSLEEWKAAKIDRPNLHKRSATYEGIEEDMMTAFPRMNAVVGLLATVGACIASSLAGVYFEKVLKDSAKSTSLWVRNVQLAVYSIFPALFIGVIFLDGEKIAANGFFGGYNWAVWSTVIVQAIGGIATSFCIGHAYRDTKNVATATSIFLTTLGSIWLFEFELTGNFILGTFSVLVATYLCEDPGGSASSPVKRQGLRPPPIHVDHYEKDSKSDDVSPASPPPNEFSIKLPGTPFLSDAGLSTSRPTSPGHVRVNAARTASGGYFDKQLHDQ